MASSKPILEKQSVSYQNQPEIEQFLTTYPFLRPILSEALDQIAAHFPAASVEVKVDTDPETPALKDLLVTIDSKNYSSEEALDRYDKFILNWWGDTWASGQDKMNIVIQ